MNEVEMHNTDRLKYVKLFGTKVISFNTLELEDCIGKGNEMASFTITCIIIYEYGEYAKIKIVFQEHLVKFIREN